MPIQLGDYEAAARRAVKTYWATLKNQGAKGGDQGARSGVTGGRQMDGFADLVEGVLRESGLATTTIYREAKLELPGYFRPEKKWDFLVVHNRNLLAAIEFKSQAGPSYGNNFNNRSEEAVGVTHDFAVARREGMFGQKVIQPWVGWLMLLEDDEKSRSPVGLKQPHFPADRAFQDASYATRYEELFRRLQREKLVDGACLLLAPKGRNGTYTEPAADLALKTFLANLAGHLAGYQASVR
jgi:hypothetical protein